MGLNRFLDQERAPVSTAVSCLTTLAVEVVILLAARSVPSAGFAAAGVAFLTGLLVLGGIAINIVLGSVAHSRGEYGGGWIAAAGIAIWLLTIGSVTGIPQYRAREKERARTWGQN